MLDAGGKASEGRENWDQASNLDCCLLTKWSDAFSLLGIISGLTSPGSASEMAADGIA